MMIFGAADGQVCSHARCTYMLMSDMHTVLMSNIHTFSCQDVHTFSCLICMLFSCQIYIHAYVRYAYCSHAALYIQISAQATYWLNELKNKQDIEVNRIRAEAIAHKRAELELMEKEHQLNMMIKRETAASEKTGVLAMVPLLNTTGEISYLPVDTSAMVASIPMMPTSMPILAPPSGMGVAAGPEVAVPEVAAGATEAALAALATPQVILLFYYFLFLSILSFHIHYYYTVGGCCCY
jgi:hypothetical protein